MKNTVLSIILSSAFWLTASTASASMPSLQWGCYSLSGQNHACRNFSFDESSCQMAPPQYNCQWAQKDNSSSPCKSYCDGEAGTPQARQNCSAYSDSLYSCIENAPEAFGCYWATTCDDALSGI